MRTFFGHVKPLKHIPRVFGSMHVLGVVKRFVGALASPFQASFRQLGGYLLIAVRLGPGLHFVAAGLGLRLHGLQVGAS